MLAFHIKVAYKTRMFALVTELPLQWHRGNHSGDSIDKINKASSSLAAFSLDFRSLVHEISIYWRTGHSILFHAERSLGITRRFDVFGGNDCDFR